jgi:phosphatidylserine/phosphatidylglycerophosphate/cardiolipin synthase-like enzyme
MQTFLKVGALGLSLSLIFNAAAEARSYCPATAAQVELETQALTEKAGLTGWKQAQVNLQFHSHWPLGVLKTALHSAQASQSNEIQLSGLDFDPLSRSYQLGIRAEQWPLWDHFLLQLSTPAANQIKLSLSDNWFPSDLIFERLQTRLQGLLSPLKLQFTRQDQSMLIQWPIQSQTWQPHSELGLKLGKLTLNTQIDPQGSLSLNLSTHAPISNTQVAKHRPQISSSFQTCLTPAQKLQGTFSFNSHLEILPSDLAQIQLGQDKLSDRFQAAGKIDVALKSQFKGQLLPFKLQAKGQTTVNMPEFQAEGQHYRNVSSVPFLWRYQNPFDFSIWPDLPDPGDYQPQTRPHQLNLFIDGPAYFSEMKRVIASAQLSIDQEIFVFYDGKTTRELARLYLLKAMGLRDQGQQLSADPLAPNGIRVFLLHNHDLNQRGADKVAAIFAQVQTELFKQIDHSSTLPLPLVQYQSRLKQNFEISPLTRGIAKSDHRKLLIIDGQIAYTGGLNLADSYLTADSYHDLMIQVQGPAVAEMHQLFKDNWQDLHPGQHWREDRAQTPPTKLSGPLSQIEVLTTDDQSLQIEAALLYLIGAAKDTIRLEHAYIYHEPVEKALREALIRGVKLELIVSERNDETVFEVLNPAALLSLMRAGQPGQVKAWLYQGLGGENDFMSHTKFLSVDGQFALVGSANLVPRSLHSPFSTEGRPLLFNEELSLYIADQGFVQKLDQALFERDKNELSRAVEAPDLEKLLESRGGPKQLLLEKLKGLLS